MSYLNKEQIHNIVHYAKEAGQIAVAMQQAPSLTINTKDDGSKVTSADVTISQFLHDKLSADFPDIPIICEEGDLRKAGEIFWLIDPIDGTSSYARGQDQFAVNIALIKNRRPIFGLIYAPAFEGGKLAYNNDANQVIIVNDQECVPQKPSDQLHIVSSARIKDEEVQRFITQIHPHYQQDYQVEKLSSAVKFFRILEGNADIYLHCRRSMEWDIASGHALIELMGGQVKNLFSNENRFVIGSEMSYHKPDFANTPFIASLQDELI